MPNAPDFRLDCGPCVIRPWRGDDLPALLRYADNPKVAANLRDRFPHPYTEADARAWLAFVAADAEGVHLVIEVAGGFAGTIGLEPQKDVNAGTAEIGYWLGEPFWGRGIATAAVRALTRHALTTLGYRRLFATALMTNAASRRVLEKAGYRLEGVLRRSAVKNGRVLDQALYAIVDEDLAGTA
ncbi:MAG TPA: GNAT family N-acetyltransferase [Planctomycetaceae bacterium]